MRTVTRIALLAVLASACSGKKGEPPPTPPPGQGIEMISHGEMPRRPLRYQLAKGVKTAVELEEDVDFVTPSYRNTTPTAVTVMEIGADDVLPDGNAKVRTTILRTSARERPGASSPEAMSARGAMMDGVQITGTLTPRGRLQEPRLASTAGLPAKVAERAGPLIAQLEAVAMPLPEPDVGVGAIWRFRRDVDLAALGLKVQTITEMEVKAIEGPRVTYVMRTELKGEDQRSKIEGVEVSITKIRGTGGGEGVIDLGRMVRFGEESAELGFDLAAQQQQADSVRLHKAVRVRPAPDEAPAAPSPAKPDAGTLEDPGAH